MFKKIKQLFLNCKNKIFQKKKVKNLDDLFENGEIFKANDKALNNALKELNNRIGDSVDVRSIIRALTILSIKNNQETKAINLLNCLLSAIVISISFISFNLLKEQTEYTRIQSIPEQIEQARSKNKAMEFCKENPDAKESGLFFVNKGVPAPCSSVLKDTQ